MESRNFMPLAVDREFPLIAHDDQGKRHLLGMARALDDTGGFSVIFDDTSSDSFVKKVISSIAQGVVNALTITPTQPLEPDMERE
jgi:hypothetical protein